MIAKDFSRYCPAAGWHEATATEPTEHHIPVFLDYDGKRAIVRN